MSDAEEKKKDPKSFWETMPGILTGLAALVTAIGGCITIIVALPRPNIIFPATPSAQAPPLSTATPRPPAPGLPTDTLLPPPTDAPPGVTPSPTVPPPQSMVLHLDRSMSLNRLVGACAGGIFSGDWVDLYGFRVGVSPIEDCPPPSHSTILLTFDVSDLTDATLLEATLMLDDYQIIGDPFAQFGDLFIDEVSYTEIGPSSAVLETRLKELARLGGGPARLDVKQALADAIGRGSKRFQLRLQYEIQGVDFRDFDEAIATPQYYLVWNADAITLNVVFSP